MHQNRSHIKTSLRRALKHYMNSRVCSSTSMSRILQSPRFLPEKIRTLWRTVQSRIFPNLTSALLSVQSIYLPSKHTSLFNLIPPKPQYERKYRQSHRTRSPKRMAKCQRNVSTHANRLTFSQYYINPQAAKPGTLGTQPSTKDLTITPVTQWLSVSFLYLFYGTNMIHWKTCFIVE